MGRDNWSGKIEAYVDGELPPDEMRALDAHLKNCADCAADALSRIQLKNMTQLAGKRFSPDAEFRLRVQKKIARGRAGRYQWGWLLKTAPVALALAVIAIAGVQWNQRSQREKVFGELADLHVASLASLNPVDVVSTDRHTVKPWFAGKLPFTFNLPELHDSPFILLGGRVTYFDQMPGAQLLFEVRKHRISVFIFQNRDVAGGLESGDSASRQSSFNFETWSQEGLRYFVVSDAGAEDVHELSELMKIAART
jgi:anti-sigma factor RsiW